MDFKNLTAGRFDQAQAASSDNATQSSLLPRCPHTPPYQANEVDIKRMEQQDVYLPHARKYAEKFSVKIVLNMEQALNLRRQSLLVLTIREADIAARWQAPLDSGFMHKALKAVDGMLMEGIPGEKDNPYFLRETYNRGIDFKKRFYHKVEQARKDAADKAMIDILAKLEKISLPAWEEEIVNGFPVELCKPEFMSWEQYREAARNFITRSPEGDFDELPADTAG